MELVTVEGDLWNYYDEGYHVVIPTNLIVRQDRSAVMGAGLALEAARRFPGLDQRYGEHLLEVRRSEAARQLGDAGTSVPYEEGRLVLVPTKWDWRDPSMLFLIDAAGRWLARRFQVGGDEQVAVPQLGCGLGALDWERSVLPCLREHLLSPPFVAVVTPRRPHLITAVRK